MFYIILGITMSFLDLKDDPFLQGLLFYVFLCVHFHCFTSTLCMYVMCLTSLTDYFDDRRLLFAMTKSVFRSFKVLVVEVAELKN